MTQLEQIEQAANRVGASLTLTFSHSGAYPWVIEWESQSPFSTDETKLVRCANRKSTAVEFLYEDLVRLGTIKET